METKTHLSRVGSLVNQVLTADWERKIGAWAVTFLSLAAVWLVTDRAVETLKALVLPEEYMPGIELNPFELLLEIPIEVLPTIIGLGVVYLFALGIWRLGSRWVDIEDFRSRFTVLFGLGFGVSTLLAALLVIVLMAAAVYIGEDPMIILQELDLGVMYLVGELAKWAVVSGVITAVASWRRDDVELTVEQKKLLAVAVAAIVVVPATLGAAGIAAPNEGLNTYEGSISVVSAMDDGEYGPDSEELASSNLTRAEFRPATQVLRCGQVNESSFSKEDSWRGSYATAAEYNISRPGDDEQHRLLLAPYRDASGDVVHGRYAFRIRGVADNWSVNTHWTSHTEYAGDNGYNGETGLNQPYSQNDLSNGTFVMEQVTSTTLVVDLVNPDGEIVRLRYRLCRPDGGDD